MLSKPNIGLYNGMLKPCSKRPNCVCSEYPDTQNYFAPLNYSGSDIESFTTLAQCVENLGGTILRQAHNYLHATFTSNLFGFIDDLELRLDAKNKCIHLRSAARTGYYDFGVNRKRAQKIRKLLQEKGLISF